MPFDQIRGAALKPGKIVPLVLNMLPGEPVIHVEYLGETNLEFWNDSIARANAKTNAVDGVSKLSPQKIRENRAKNRVTIAKYSVRHIEAKHSDGRAATDDDIPEFVDSLPDEVFDVVRDFVGNPENFRERRVDGDVKAIAEK